MRPWVHGRRLGWLLSGAGLGLALGLLAGADRSERVRLLGLEEDMARVLQVQGKLKLDLEALEREQAALRARLARLEEAPATTTDYVTQTQLQHARVVWQRESVQAREALAAEMTRQLEELASKTRAALEALQAVRAPGPSAARAEAPEVAPEEGFSDDFPQTGFAYTVEPGDTLSGIAQRFGARVRDIQNANRIANPARDLKAGQTIFIPVEEQAEGN